MKRILKRLPNFRQLLVHVSASPYLKQSQSENGGVHDPSAAMYQNGLTYRSTALRFRAMGEQQIAKTTSRHVDLLQTKISTFLNEIRRK